MNRADKIYVAGHRGMVGSAIVRKLEQQGFFNLVVKTSAELDLRNQKAVNDFFEEEKPSYVFFGRSKSGRLFKQIIYIELTFSMITL